jgi:hypothetical protein
VQHHKYKQAHPLWELVVDTEVPTSVAIAVATAHEAVGRRRQGPLRLPPRAAARAHPLQPIHHAPHPQDPSSSLIVNTADSGAPSRLGPNFLLAFSAVAPELGLRDEGEYMLALL